MQNFVGQLNPPSRKAELFAAPAADWIWGPVVAPDNKVSQAASYTGDVVFFKEKIDIPSLAYDIQADLFVITVDNAYYFYVNDDWSGTPDGLAGFNSGYNPTNFYYTSDGINNLGGGTNSVAYEIVGNLYPKDAAIDTSASAWNSIEEYDISSLLFTGQNWLQIVAINEHAPPQGPDSNPAGLIYKVVVNYKIPIDVEVEKQVKDPATGIWADNIRVPIGTELEFRTIITNTGGIVLHNLHVRDELSIQMEYRNTASFVETSVSPDLRTIIWDFNQLGIGDSIEITYLAETVEECYGSNSVFVTTKEHVTAADLAKVKVHKVGQPVMAVTKSVWDGITDSWQESTNSLLGKELSFKLLISSTSITPLDVNIIDYLPDSYVYSDDANIAPVKYSQGLIEWQIDQIQPGETKEIIYHATPTMEGLEDSIVTLTTSDSHQDEDSILVNIVDPPSVELQYPKDGELISGTTEIKWHASDEKDPTIKTSYLYYREENDELWKHLNNIIDGSTEFLWDSTTVYDGEYQLQVVVEDTDGLYAQDISESFIIDNDEHLLNPPNIPDRPSGETNIKVDTVSTYTTYSTDIDNHDLYYLWDWDDDTYSGWLGPFKSGEVVEADHIWSNDGSYTIQVKAKDVTGAVTDWSESLSVSISKDKSYINRPFLNFLQNFLEQYPILYQLLQRFLQL